MPPSIMFFLQRLTDFSLQFPQGIDLGLCQWLLTIPVCLYLLSDTIHPELSIGIATGILSKLAEAVLLPHAYSHPLLSIAENPHLRVIDLSSGTPLDQDHASSQRVLCPRVG